MIRRCSRNRLRADRWLRPVDEGLVPSQAMGVSKGTKAPSRDGKTQPSRVSCRLPAVFRCEDSPGGGSGEAAQPLKADQEQLTRYLELLNRDPLPAPVKGV